MKNQILIILILSTNTIFGQNTSSIANEIESIVSIKDYEMAKKKAVEFYKTLPENPTELQIVAKYEVSKIESRIDQFLYSEQTLYDQVKNYQNLKAGKQFLIDYPYSSKRKEVNWLIASITNSWSSYNSFLNSYSSGDFVVEAKTRRDQIDTQTYKNAQSSESISAMKSYVENIFNGKYIPDAKRWLAEKLEEEEFYAAKRKNTVNAYSDYLTIYPTGKFSFQAQTLIEDAQFNLGEDAFKKKNWQTAIKGFEEYLRIYQDKSKSQMAQNRIAAAKRKLLFQSTAISYLTYDFDKENQVGLSYGTLYNPKANLYMKLKVNKEFFDRGGIFATADNSGYSSSPNKVLFTGDNQYNNWSFILGLNIKVYDPCWIYFGGGVLNRGLYFEADEYDSFGDYKKTRWMKNTDIESYKFVGEGGVAVNVLNKGIVKLGLSYYENRIIPQFGIGIAW